MRKIQRKIKNFSRFIIIIAFGFSFLSLAAPATVSAQLGGDDPGEFEDIQDRSANDRDCRNTDNPQALEDCLQGNPIVRRLQQVINFLSIGVAIIVVGAIIVGGIRYMTAGNNPQAVGEAKKLITNALIALLAFIFLFAFLQWLIPGGVFE